MDEETSSRLVRRLGLAWSMKFMFSCISFIGYSYFFLHVVSLPPRKTSSFLVQPFPHSFSYQTSFPDNKAIFLQLKTRQAISNDQHDNQSIESQSQLPPNRVWPYGYDAYNSNRRRSWRFGRPSLLHSYIFICSTQQSCLAALGGVHSAAVLALQLGGSVTADWERKR